MNLRTPGPIPVPPEVAEAGAAPMINHRGPEFAELISELTEGLKHVYRTENDVLVITGSGTAGMEAAVVNHVQAGDRVLVVTIGVFGERFLELVRTYGGDPVHLEFEYGTTADPARIDEALAADPELRAVLVTHNETSTGVTNPLEDIARVVRQHDRLLIVDAISSLSSIPVETDAWGLDVVVSGSQKGWMVSPGLAFVSVSERAWAAQERCTNPRMYLDLQRAQRSLENGQTPWTPGIALMFQLRKAIELLRAEGVEAVWARHRETAQQVRAGLEDLGLELFAKPGGRSDTVTAIRPPEGIAADEIRAIARSDFDTVFAGGQASLRGQILRFGHLGHTTPEDVRGGLEALRGALVKLGHATPAVSS